ncbi:hypothetical protein QYE76_070342 [Lolium multiflorum]|uniref:CCHC-type domain-containing protein n=1 Tax=Lolium multiflorum TaxID=4521 RepID=A0AAD8SI06_LOLMU|nr:hypothetical protein QYE76_070342 [Lolium multiflorum]
MHIAFRDSKFETHSRKPKFLLGAPTELGTYRLACARSPRVCSPSWLGGGAGDLFKKIVKRPGLLLRGACEVVVELAISGAEEKLTIRKGPLSFVGVVRRIGGNQRARGPTVLSLKKDLEKRHEGKSALDTMLSVQQSPNDKSGLEFNSNNKNKSKSKSNKNKGQDKVKDPAKLVCFKCKVEGHHVRSCPLKKKKHLVRNNKGNGHKVKVKLMLDLKLKIGHFPRRIKILFPKRRNQ